MKFTRIYLKILETYNESEMRLHW